MKIISVSNPVYSSSDNATVDCIVTFDDGNAYPFTAAATDCTPHGQQLWAELTAGTHGPVAAYVAPAVTPARLQAQALDLLGRTDAVATRCFKAGVAFPAEWQAYVAALRAVAASGTGSIPAQPDYPAGT